MQFAAVEPQVNSITFLEVNRCGPSAVKPNSLPDLLIFIRCTWSPYPRRAYRPRAYCEDGDRSRRDAWISRELEANHALVGRQLNCAFARTLSLAKSAAVRLKISSSSRNRLF